MLGWILAIIFYLLGAGIVFLMEYEHVHGWEDWTTLILITLAWPILAAVGIVMSVKEEIEYRNMAKRDV